MEPETSLNCRQHSLIAPEIASPLAHQSSNLEFHGLISLRYHVGHQFQNQQRQLRARLPKSRLCTFYVRTVQLLPNSGPNFLVLVEILAFHELHGVDHPDLRTNC